MTSSRALHPPCLLVLFALCAAVEPLSAQGDTDPLSPADRARIESYGEAFAVAVGASHEARLRTVSDIFAEATIAEYGPERLAGLFERLRADFGVVDFDNAELAEVDMGSRISRILHVYVRSPIENRWKDLQLRLEPTAPYRVQELGFVASVTEPVYLPNGAIDDPATLEWLDRYVTKLATEDDLSGSLLVARGSRPLLERVYGHEDAEGARPVTAESGFNLGSGNKMFTALVVAQLVEQGRLSLDAPLGRFFPDLFDAHTRERVTVHHLLSHTSGIADYWTPEYEAAWRGLEDLESILPFVERAGVDFEPGSRWAYSNSNFLLAGLIVERVLGEDYFDVVRRSIYEPLEMTHSGSFVDEGSRLGRADPLRRAGEGWTRAHIPLRGSSAGGGYSTARDMLRFVRGLVAGQIVSPSMLEVMVRPQHGGMTTATQYGYGFIIEEIDGVRSFGHGGTADGINFELRYFPEDDLTLVVFSNQDNGAFDDLRRNVIRLISGER